MEVLSPPVKQSFAADFDQVSSFGCNAMFPDNIACCGNRNLKVSGDTHVALSVHTWLQFYIWPSQTLWFSVLALCSDTFPWLETWHLKHFSWLTLGKCIWCCWNGFGLEKRNYSNEDLNITFYFWFLDLNWTWRLLDLDLTHFH